MLFQAAAAAAQQRATGGVPQRRGSGGGIGENKVTSGGVIPVEAVVATGAVVKCVSANSAPLLPPTIQVAGAAVAAATSLFLPDMQNWKLGQLGEFKHFRGVIFILPPRNAVF